MTNPHPLTDDLAERIAIDAPWCDERKETVFTHDDMRSSANWQLECDAEFFKDFLVKALHISPVIAVSMAQDFRAAMRPQPQQQQEDNNDQ